MSIHNNSVSIRSKGDDVNTMNNNEKNEIKDKYLQIRVSEKERERIKQIATDNGFESYSEYIRQLILGRKSGVLTSGNKNGNVNTSQWIQGFKTFASLFNKAMKVPEIRNLLAKYLSEGGKPSADFVFIMDLMKKLKEVEK